MSKEKRVYLAAIRRRMQSVYAYETREKRNHAFETFWYGWTHKKVRATGVHPASYRQRWIRGYIKPHEAKDFWDYITE